tara:strand:- start:90 stop:683 length:594 start_codon:yes stop_codon:yes gene_type:complete
MRITETKKKKMPVEDKIIDSFSGRRKNVHAALAAAGMTPAYGNIADAADAILYATEGKFGEAALSLAAMIPIAGQYVAAKGVSKIVSRVPKKLKKYTGKNDVVKSLDVGGKSVGHISGTRTSKGIEIHNIHVDPEYRRLGFGTDLYKSLQEETSEYVYSRGWQQNPKTAGKVWDSLVKSGKAEMIKEGMEPVYYLRK